MQIKIYCIDIEGAVTDDQEFSLATNNYRGSSQLPVK